MNHKATNENHLTNSTVENILLCHGSPDDSITTVDKEDGPLLWSEPQQGLTLGSYFWGYFLTQVPGGRIAELYGGKWVFWVAVFINVVATLLIPVCSMAGYQYLIIMRVLMGLGAGVTFPAMNVLIAKWAPEEERSTISSIIYGGTSLGTVLSIPSSGKVGILGLASLLSFGACLFPLFPGV
jgi:ACS family sodium-dependent inorganic phosphate cotransporter